MAKPISRVLAKLNASGCDFAAHGTTAISVLAKLLQGSPRDSAVPSLRHPDIGYLRHVLHRCLLPLGRTFFAPSTCSPLLCRPCDSHSGLRALRPRRRRASCDLEAMRRTLSPRRRRPLRLSLGRCSLEGCGRCGLLPLGTRPVNAGAAPLACTVLNRREGTQSDPGGFSRRFASSAAGHLSPSATAAEAKPKAATPQALPAEAIGKALARRFQARGAEAPSEWDETEDGQALHFSEIQFEMSRYTKQIEQARRANWAPWIEHRAFFRGCHAMGRAFEDAIGVAAVVLDVPRSLVHGHK